jgi:serine/threonine-protein kinase
VNANSTTWAPTAANTYNLSYTIFCGESVESAQSPTTSYEITPATGGTGGNGG